MTGAPAAPTRFRHFAAIDWSGAAGERHAGIAVALCDADGGAPRLVRPRHRWSRMDVLHWLQYAMPKDTLIGLDLGTSLPFADNAAFFPGWTESPATARELWALVDRICEDDPYLSASGFVDHPVASAYFRRSGGREGTHFAKGAIGGRGRFRVTEHAQQASGCKPYSNFNLIGAAQVGKSSLTGMRVLHRLGGRIPVWPFDPMPESGSLVVEIYTTLAAIAAGRSAARSKMRSRAELNHALAALDCPPAASNLPINDHTADALLTAVWLRRAATRDELWHPAGMTPEIARTEGWTFGAA